MQNHLKDATSPYLQQHAGNPVDWHPWSDHAWKLARERDVPVFLSIGYAACHWCHVMAHESFVDPHIAALMNKHFVNIKVDREERPDIDSIYMDAVVAMTGQGGWPMSLFLTPEGKPFFAGTYFPPRRSHQLPSFLEVLEHIIHIWKEQRDDAEEAGESIRLHLLKRGQLHSGTMTSGLIQNAAQHLVKHVDKEHGGWGGAPKFPQPLVIDFLLAYAWQHSDAASQHAAETALQSMAFGGIHDQIEGGFHRYSVDNHWLVPHFEKMLYDNAQLARVYLHAWQYTRRRLYWEITERTLDFLLRDLAEGSGAFISSLDADSDGVEGKTYLWDYESFTRILQENGLPSSIADIFGVTIDGNFEGQTILHRPFGDSLPTSMRETSTQAEEQIQQAIQVLATSRRTRAQPGRDEKVILGWNGLVLITFAEAARAFRNPTYLQTARQLAAFLLDNLVQGSSTYRTWRAGKVNGLAVLQDHAALGQGLLALYQADADPRWLHAAITQAEEILTHFLHPEAGFFDTRDDHEPLLIRPMKWEDMPIASGNALASDLLLRLASLTGEDRYKQAGMKAIQASVTRIQRAPAAYAAWLSTALCEVGPRPQIAIIDHGHESLESPLARIVHDYFLPPAVLAYAREPADFPALLNGRDLIEGAPAAYVCLDMTCRLPVTDPEELRTQLHALHSLNLPDRA